MKSKILLFSVLAIFLIAGNSMAIPLGENITIFDGVANGTGWYSDREDQEVEPGCLTGQTWDLEGFFLDGSTLTMVGGFDFKNGVPDPYPWRNLHYDSGDIFIDTEGGFNYGTPGTGGGLKVIQNTFGYEYVLDLDFEQYLSDGTLNSGYLKYTVWGLDNASTVTVYFGQNDESNPWRYHDGGTALTDYTGVAFDYWSGLADDKVAGLEGEGGPHYAAAFDLSFLGASMDFNAHFTYECGNDNLIGSGKTGEEPPPIPEPGTMLLLGFGLIGLAGFGRKKFFKR